MDQIQASFRSAIYKLYQLLRYEQARLTEFNAASLSLVWGFWMAWPWWNDSPIDPAPSTFLYRTLTSFVPLHVYGWIFLAVGVLWHIGLFKDSRKIRRIGAFGSFLIWIFISLFILQEDFRHVIAPTALLFSWSSVLCYLRLGTDGNKGAYSPYASSPYDGD